VSGKEVSRASEKEKIVKGKSEKEGKECPREEKKEGSHRRGGPLPCPGRRSSRGKKDTEVARHPLSETKPSWQRNQAGKNRERGPRTGKKEYPGFAREKKDKKITVVKERS